jgi:methyl-accepting chemotaxis protein
MTQGITAQANQTKSDREGRNAQSLGVFDKSISDLRASLKTQTAEIDKNAPGKGFLSFLGPLGQAVEAVVDTAKTLSAPTSRKIPTVEQVKSTTATQTAGTFSGFAAGMIGGTTSALDRMADQSAKSNELLTQIAKNTGENQPLVFGS